MRRTECEKCEEDVYVVSYVPSGSNRLVEVEVDVSPIFLMSPTDEKNSRFALQGGYRRHRETCEALQGVGGVGAAALPDEAGDEAGEIDEAKAKELSADLPPALEPPGPGTS